MTNNGQEPRANVVFTIPEALDALRAVIDTTPTVAIVGTLTAFKPGRRWATGEIAAQQPGHPVDAQLRLSFPPAHIPPKSKATVGSTVRVTGRFIVDSRYGPVQFRVANTTVIEDQAAEAVAVEQLAVSIRHEQLHLHQKRVPLPETASRVVAVCPLNQGAGGRDFINRLQTSGHDWHITPLEVPMGGPAAATQIAGAIQTTNRNHRQNRTEVVVVCRGGGSPAELAVFNSETVARAIVESRLPVVVARSATPTTTTSPTLSPTTQRQHHQRPRTGSSNGATPKSAAPKPTAPTSS